MPKAVADDFLTIASGIRVLPIVHGSGDFAIRVREELLARPYDAVAVPLPPAFQEDVEEAVERLPEISAVVRQDVGDEGFSFVPIDPCQGVVAAIRTAIGERIPREYIDLDSPRFEAVQGVFPDPYALKRVSVERFSAALLPAIPRPSEGFQTERIAWMASRLREISRRRKLTLLVCSILDWPWIRDAYRRELEAPEPEPVFESTASHRVDPGTLLFFLGELPFLTALYERGRRELTPDDNLSVDGIKELILQARESLRGDRPKLAARVTPSLLATLSRYVRNLALIDRRLTPDLYTLVTAARQTAGDDFALAVAETAREYAYAEPLPDVRDEDDPGVFRMGVGRADIPGWGLATVVNRLPGQATTWRTCRLRPRPQEPERKRWLQRWDPYGMCSWPPEDDRIESFHRHVKEQARAILGADLARSEKFTTSVRDGLDIRETLRNWHTGDVYVKVVPPGRGSIEVVVFLFDVPADPKVYTNRATWYAEHSEESTLAFYATDPFQNMIGPGIAQAQYGGALFLFPARPIPEIWTDSRIARLDTLEERLLAAGFLHSRDRHVAVVSPGPPWASWRRLARSYGRKIVHLPLKRFSGQMIERLRTFHVLNGKHVRSFAADYIREL
ncbi:hypothetical protein [Paludisphaera rhizosphaerae]|uniref:hypothetical protein n=1 Tax=Paludisphaera rhizosphaerae TaxID=2711216 RepID=UPI0013ED7DD8